MKGKPRKYISEYAINLCTARVLMVTASQLLSGWELFDSDKEIADCCHIYIISKMPRICFRQDTFEYKNGRVSGHLQYKVLGEVREAPFDIEFPLVDGATTLELSSYPHREIRTYNDNREVIRYFPANVIMHTSIHRKQRKELQHLEVLYVGQAFGDGNRSAYERLQSHNTLQKILADLQAECPDDEVYLLMFEYVPYRIFSMINGSVKAKKSIDEDSAHFFSIQDNPLTEHQQICLAEASLIRYFGPKYNSIYKDSFPSRSHKILAECYNLDFSALTIEINTEELYHSLYSEHTSPKQHHICQIDLVADEDRQSFFCLSGGEGHEIEIPGIIKGARSSKA